MTLSGHTQSDWLSRTLNAEPNLWMLRQLSQYYISQAALPDTDFPLVAPVDLLHLHLCTGCTAHLKQYDIIHSMYTIYTTKSIFTMAR